MLRQRAWKDLWAQRKTRRSGAEGYSFRVRSVLRAAVDMRVLAKFLGVPAAKRPGKKLPRSPARDEVETMLEYEERARGTTRVVQQALFEAAHAWPPANGAGAHPLIAGSGWQATWDGSINVDLTRRLRPSSAPDAPRARRVDDELTVEVRAVSFTISNWTDKITITP